ncbi:MAG: TonB-dependent receptor [Proteobacteria bacterium]|nr:TonB-dependent receptor [Pseudomonadota bacterium]
MAAASAFAGAMLGAVSLTAGAARAAPARTHFQIASKPYSEALLDLAQQANLTLLGASACQGTMPQRFTGAMAFDRALDQILADAPCAWKLVAPDTVEITARRHEGEHATPPPVSEVSELLVTATKRVRDPRQLAVSVSAVSGQALQSVGATDAASGSAELGGMLSTNLGPGRDKLLLRGISDGAYTGRTRQMVATYIDNLPINYNAPDPDLRLTDVERVEIVRGPQGTLYGSGSMSGVYRIVSRQPDLQQMEAEARVTGAYTQDGAPSEAIEAYGNYPLWRGVAAMRLAAYGELDGGYLDDMVVRRRDANRTERHGARFTVLVQPTDAWTVDFTAALQHLRSDDTQYTSPGLGLTRVNRILEPHQNDIGFATGTVKHSWSWADFTSTTGYVEHAYRSLYDATAVQNLYTVFADTSAYSEVARTKMLVEDAFLTSRGSGRFQWLFGLYAADTRQHSPTQFLAQHSFAPDVEVYGDNRYDRITELAIYGEASFQIDPVWSVAVGGRAFGIRTHTTSAVVSENFAPRNLDRSTSFSGFSPKVSIQREFGPGDLIYAVMSQGFRPGGVNSGGAVPLPVERETYGPDKLQNFEVGLKLDALDHRLSLNSAVFYEIWKDLQTDQFRPSGIPFTTNAGDAYILGVEADVAYRLGGGFTVELNGRLSQSRTEHPNPAFPVLPNTLPGAPAGSGGGMITYERLLRGDWLLRLTGATAYIGRSRVTFDGSFPPQGGYVSTKLVAEIRRGRYGAQVFLTNPSNAFSDTFAFGNPFNPTQIRQVTPQQPRTLGMTFYADY